MSNNFLSHKLSLLVLFLSLAAFQSHAQILPWVSNCDHCPTLGLQINVNPDGECGFAFDYSGLIGCDIVSAEWRFGIPSLPLGTDSGNHVYFEFPPGTHTVTLVLTLSDGSKLCRKSISTTVVVDPNACNPNLICTGGAFNFANQGLDVFVGPDCEVFFGRISSPLPGNAWQITDMTWNFGDGNLYHGIVAGVIYKFVRDGTYTVCMTITMSDGVDTCQRKFCRQVTVEGCGPKKKESSFEETALSIFPNPVQAGDRITLRGELDPAVREITMVDAQGRIVERWNTSDSAGSEQEFTVPVGASPGIYFLRSNSPAMTVQKVIVR